jgi:hypothetical protein
MPVQYLHLKWTMSTSNQTVQSEFRVSDPIVVTRPSPSEDPFQDLSLEWPIQRHSSSVFRSSIGLVSTSALFDVLLDPGPLQLLAGWDLSVSHMHIQ